MMKRYFTFLIFIAALSACKLDSITFTNPKKVSDPFFSKVIAQANKRGMLLDTSLLTGQMDIYRVRFREQQVEESGVLEWRMISEHDRRFNHTDSSYTSGQNIYMYRLYTEKGRDVFVYFSITVSADGLWAGAGPAYLGILDSTNMAPTVSIYERLDFEMKHAVAQLVPAKKSAKRKSPDHILRFQLVNNVKRGDCVLNIAKVIVVEKNKTGGDNPIFYPITSMLGENALLMNKQPGSH